LIRMISFSETRSAFGDREQMTRRADQPAILRRVGDGHRLMSFAQTESAHRLRDILELPVDALLKSDFQLLGRHDLQPMISSRDLPRLAAISSGERTEARALTVARTTLIALREP